MATNAKNLAEYLNNETTSATADIANASITADKLASNAVTTAKIADDAVSSAKLFAENLGRRNIVINGAMEIAQRGTSATGKGASSFFQLDRFRQNHNGNSAGRYTVTRDGSSGSVHDGFTKSLKLACTTADTSIGATERFFIEYPFEGRDLQQFRKGSSDAKDFVVSFYAKANGNFTYVVGFYDNDNNRTVSRTFSVTSSWQRFTINFGADTSGAFDNDNALSLQLRFYLHAGSNYTSASLQTSWNAVNNAATAGGMTSSFYSSTSNTFFLTGVQLEVGDKGDGTSTATPFEHRSFYEEHTLCSRYYRNIGRIMQGYREGYSTASITLYPGMRRIGNDATNIVGTIGSSGVMYSRSGVNDSTGTLNGTIGHSSSSNDQALQVSFSHNGASTGSSYNGTVGALYVDSVTLDAEL